VIASPASGLVVNQAALSLAGTADPYAKGVRFYINNIATGAPASVAAGGGFSGQLTLAPGTNLIQAAATNRAGTGARSAAVTVAVLASYGGGGAAGPAAAGRYPLPPMGQDHGRDHS
jgi:hypothetical protein